LICRHWDHKFEWSREEFETWCLAQGTKYGYSCEFSGVGEPGHCGNLEQHGYCSQICVFTRDCSDLAARLGQLGITETHDNEEQPRTGKKYKLIAQHTFPCHADVDSVANCSRLIVSLVKAALLKVANTNRSTVDRFNNNETVYVHVSKAVNDVKAFDERLASRASGYDVRCVIFSLLSWTVGTEMKKNV
jgi:hypothetical protein